MTATPEQIKRLVDMFSGFAKEAVTAQQIGSMYYAFGSELACLRIFAHYNKVHNPNTAFGYSENMKTFYFRLDSPK